VTTNGMINATDPAFHQAPESFHGIRVDIADDIDLLIMLNPTVPVSRAHVAHSVVHVPLIGEHGRFRHDVFLDNRKQGRTLNVLSCESLDPALTLRDAEDRSFGLHLPSASLLADTSEVGLIHLHARTAFPAKRPGIIGQHRANLFEHAPRGFICHSGFALNLLGRNSAARRSHQVDRIEPSGQRRRRLVEDRASSRVNMVAALVARIGWAADYTMMLCDALALLAKDAFWVQAVAEPLKTGFVVGKLAVKVFLSKLSHFRFAVHAVPTVTTQTITECIPTVKG